MKKFLRVVLYLVLIGAGLFGGKLLWKNDAPPPPVPSFFQQDSTGTSNLTFSGEIIEVKDGESIQEAVGKAKGGDLIRVYPGTYYETVYIDKDNIGLQGVIREGKYPVMDGKKELNDAILYSGSNILVENFTIINYKGNGIMGQAGNNFIIRNNIIKDAGVYGIFPQFGKNGLIEYNVLSGIEDAAIYVGMCDNIDVRHNEVFENVAGIEIENSRHALVENNLAYNNTGGILAFITPGLPIKTTYDVIIRNNFIKDNNHENFGAPGSLVAGIPPGTGILIMAADQVTIENNIISGNDNAGITITDLTLLGMDLANDPEIQPDPDNLIILDNLMSNNGSNPVGELKILKKAMMISEGLDIVAVGKGSGSCIKNIGNYKTFGLGGYSRCDLPGTENVTSYRIANGAEERDISFEEMGKLTFYGVCSGCHSFNVRLIGPPTTTIQALYKNNPEGIAEYIANPIHKREDYPEMPTQKHLTEETRLAVAKFMLELTN